MKKAFLITGLTFALFLVMIIGVNYIVLIRNTSSSSNVLNMKIDKVYNRYIDTQRALEAAKREATTITKVGVTCDSYLNSVLNDPNLDMDGVRVEGRAVGCIANFRVETYDKSIVKIGSFP